MGGFREGRGGRGLGCMKVNWYVDFGFGTKLSYGEKGRERRTKR